MSTIPDFTVRKDAAKRLAQMEDRYRGLMEAAPDAMVVVDQDGKIVLVNLQTEKQFGYHRDELLGQKIENIIPDGFAERLLADGLRSVEEALAQQIGTGIELTGRRKDGSEFPIEIMLSPLESAGGIQVTAAIRDISKRKATESRIVQLNRVYAVLSGINTLIVRVRDRDELFREACRIAVVDGGFLMSLIAIPDEGGAKVVPAGSAGKDEELLETIKGALSGEGAPITMVVRAIREKEIFVSNDSQRDPDVLFGAKYAERGVHSMAVLPLIVADRAVGAFALYAGENDFFHEEEMKLLMELAGDIAFAIDHIDNRERLEYLAYYDALTGLANRGLFHDRLANSLRARGKEQPLVTIALLDLERFRQVNETLGRDAGDELLREVGSRLEGLSNNAARIGVDMFGLLLRGARTESEVNRALEAIIAACFAEPFVVGDEELRVVCRAGVAIYPDDGTNADVLMQNAEAALRRSKRSGDRVVYYTPEMNARVAEAMAMETRLRQAVERREFVLHYQPKVGVASGRIIGLEALIRWQDPGNGLVPPARFIPILEETGMIVEVGRRVVEQAFVDLRAWLARGLSAPRVAVNVSAMQLQRKDFVDTLVEEIRCGGDCAELLELEVTESVVMRDVEDSTRKLAILRGMGVTIAVDDFGTGYSSLSYLGRLPLDSLKIDQSFVAGMTGGSEAAAIVSTIIALAHGLNLKVVAEGVETQEQSDMLHQLGCDEAQGYFYSRPMPADRIEALLRDGGALPAT